MRRSTDNYDDKYLVEGIRNSNRQAFTDLFDTYYVSLVMFCGTYIEDIEECRDIVSEIFSDLWSGRYSLVVNKSLKAYLFGTVRNRALNEIRHKKVIDSHAREVLNDGLLASHDVEKYIMYTEMKTNLERTVSSMPDNVRQAYECYMEEGMKTKDIAVIQKVTQRTVELRIQKALEILKHAFPVLVILVLI